MAMMSKSLAGTKLLSRISWRTWAGRWLLIGAGRLVTSVHPRCVMSFLMAGLLSMSIVEIDQYDLRPCPRSVKLLLCCFDQLVGPFSSVCVVYCSLPTVQIDDHQRCG